MVWGWSLESQNTKYQIFMVTRGHLKIEFNNLISTSLDFILEGGSYADKVGFYKVKPSTSQVTA